MRRLLIFCFLPLSLWAAKLQYEVRFYGVTDAKLLKALESSSELLLLQERPPATVNGLHYRARADIPKLQKVMKAFAYYDAEIYYEIQPQGDSLQVDLFVHMGPLFHLRSYEIVHGDCLQPLALERCSFCLQELGLKIGERADANSIVRAETAVLNELARCGYPLAYIDKRRVLVDMRDAEVDAAVCVQEGPLAKFGPSTLFGLKSVQPRFIERKIAWREGEPFDLDLVDKTQERLIQTDLFSSVMVSHSEELDEEGELPMKLRLSEAKHRSVGIGFFYATVDGPGGTFTWSNKNLRGMGEQIAIEIDGSERFVGGTATYRKPDFLRFEQTLSFVAEVSREDINPYLAFTYAEANFLERRIDQKQMLTLGLKGEYITVHQSANNGVFFLLGLPFTYKYDDSNSPMDPTTGFLFSYAATPFQSLRESNVHFIKQRLVLNFYIPMMENKRVTLALHTEFGSVAGAHQDDVPLPELYLGGSLYDLRGYAYKTVSPLNARGQPLGGRGAIFATAELRLRITETIGIVPFFDCGTVTLSPYPQVVAKWYKSVGAGVRYYTFFGPLRLDVGFPLDPRKGLDTWGKVYASIGQCF